ncbi:MAG: hypothetical protein HC855_05390 [Rhizobiales bacterium]|nr:hypothetical protein [Hyphomicrobiales bacterium]
MRKLFASSLAMGITGEAAFVELFVSGEGTWTITASNTQGLTCVIASGESWQTARNELAGLGS